MIPEYIIRMNEELNELNDRITKAHLFFNAKNSQFNQSTFDLLDEQIQAMTKYRNVLLTRIRNSLHNHFYSSKCDDIVDKGVKFTDWLKEVLQ